MRVKAQDANRNVVKTSASIEGDHRRIEVPWSEGDLAALIGETVQLRFSLRDARFYSYWLEQ
jgi:hypothetical protein